jgi:Cu(I)/Ag(I) efflux system membrane fusion protein
LTAERLFLERLKAGPAASSVSEVATARERLLELGLTAEEVAKFEATREPDA